MQCPIYGPETLEFRPLNLPLLIEVSLPKNPISYLLLASSAWGSGGAQGALPIQRPDLCSKRGQVPSQQRDARLERLQVLHSPTMFFRERGFL